jgi:hypothetical protein
MRGFLSRSVASHARIEKSKDAKPPYRFSAGTAFEAFATGFGHGAFIMGLNVERPRAKIA